VLTCGVCVIIIYCILYYTIISYTILFYLLFFSSILPPPLLFLYNPQSSYSFYTCRYLHILIYILSFLPFPSSQSDPARSIGVDGWGVMCLSVSGWVWAGGWLFMFRSDCKVFGCISSKSEQNWCFVLVCGYWCSELVLTCGGILYYTYTIIHILLLYIIILYYTLLFLLSPSVLPILPCILFLNPLPILPFSPLPQSSDLSSILPSSSQYSIIPSQPSSYPPNIHSILVGTYIYLFIL
jgi:hypothetical protein